MGQCEYFQNGSYTRSLKVQVNFGELPKENWREWISNRKKRFFLFSAVAILIALTCTIVSSLSVLKANVHGIPHAEYSDGIGNQNNLSRIERERLLKYLHQVSSAKKYISGLSCNYPRYDELENTTKITKAFPGVISINLPRYNASSKEWETFIEDVIWIWINNHLVQIHWDMNSPFFNMDIFTFKSGNYTDKEEKWNDLMLEGSFTNTKWKEQLDFIAPHLQKLQTAGVVTILDILPQINYNYKSLVWSGRPGVNGSAKLYKMTQDYLKQKHNFISVIWVWSVYASFHRINIEELWPGGDYVDVVSVYMFFNRKLTTKEYQKLVSLAGDKPLSMEWMFYVPTTQLFAAQPRWTWFTVEYLLLGTIKRNTINKVQALFNSISVINAENITYFDLFNTN